MTTTDDGMAPPELAQYIKGEPADVAALRSAEQGQFPWPSKDNPVLAMMMDRAKQIAADSDTETALTWLAVHSWFEGALAAESRHSDADPAIDQQTMQKLMHQFGYSSPTGAQRELAGIYRAFAADRRKIIEGAPLSD